MKNSILPLVITASLVLGGCSSAYKTGQTPDDVYYSHGPTPAAAKQTQTEEDDVYKSYQEGVDDNYLRMKVSDRDKWSQIDDVNYWYGYSNPYIPYSTGWYGYPGWSVSVGMSFGYGYSGWYNPFYFTGYYGNWNNPWCWNQPVYVVTKYPTVASRPALNTAGYQNYSFDRGGSSIFNTGKSSTGNTKTSSGDLFRSIFRSPSSGGSGSGGVNSGNVGGSSWDRPSRSLNSGSSGGSSSSGSSSGGSSGGGSSRSSGGGGGRRGG
jgi:hypothetical protein